MSSMNIERSHESPYLVECDLSVIPKTQDGKYDWNAAIGCNVPYIYKDESGVITILDVNGTKLRCMCRNRVRIVCTHNFVHGRIVTLVNETGMPSRVQPRQKYFVGETYTCGPENNKSELTIMDIYYSRTKTIPELSKYPIYYYCFCKKCGGYFWKGNYSFTKIGCPICDNDTVYPGINDIPTTDPWMIPYFQGGKEEASKYVATSGKRIVPRCPECGRIWNKSIIIANLHYQHGFKCTCSDSISYPEKFMTNLLDQLEISFIRQASSLELGFDCHNKYYDFYIKDKSCIIETHGDQHYSESSANRIFKSLEEISANDKYKEEQAINNGIENYIVIDCRMSTLGWIKTAVLDSRLPDLLGFTEDDIDWSQCASYASSNIAKQVCEYYMENNATLKELMNYFHLGRKAIKTYLKRGTENGWCIYDSSVPNGFTCRPFNVYKDNKCIYTALSARHLERISDKVLGVHLDSGGINKRLNGIIDTPYKGFRFEEITDPKERRVVVYGAA